MTDQAKFYIKFESFLLCDKVTTNPSAFDSQEACQQWVDTHCSPAEFPEVEVICTSDIEALKQYAKTGVPT